MSFKKNIKLLMSITLKIEGADEQSKAIKLLYKKS